MTLAKLELHRVLDGDDALVVGDEARQQVEHRRLTGTGTTRDDDVQPAQHAGLEEVGGLAGERTLLDEVVDGELLLGELTNRERRSLHRERRDDGVHTRAIGQAGVTHGRRLVDATTDLGDDALDHPAQMVVGDEPGIGQLPACRRSM